MRNDPSIGDLRPNRVRLGRHVATGAALALLTYLVLAYGVLPWLWWEDESRYHYHPALDGVPKVARNADGIPGDPLNVGLVGAREQVVRAMLAAGWRPADTVTLRSSVAIAASVLLDRPDPDAPVSPLYVFGREQDLAFEQEVGASADRRHHVRWWQAAQLDDAGRPFWIGGASFDVGAGISHLTGQITHHIAADVDAQRDQLMASLARAGQLARQYQRPGLGPTEAGRNAEGDRYFTDGMIHVGVLEAP
jgi:LssY C-terminus